MSDIWKIVITAIVTSILSGVIAPCVIFFIQYKFNPQQEKNVTIETQKWLDKKDIFVKSIDLAQKNFIAGSISGPSGDTHIPTNNYPTVEDKNYILSRLYILSDNQEIPEYFITLFTKSISTKDIADYMLMIRKELYGNEGNFNADTMGVVFSDKRR